MPHKHPLPPLIHPRAPKPAACVSTTYPRIFSAPIISEGVFFCRWAEIFDISQAFVFFLDRVPVDRNPQNTIKFDDTTIIRLVKYSQSINFSFTESSYEMLFPVWWNLTLGGFLFYRSARLASYFFIMVLAVCFFWQNPSQPYCGLPHTQICPITSLDGIDRNFGSRNQKMGSSSALESYESLLSNAQSLAAIVWLLAKLEYERPTTMLCQKKHTVHAHMGPLNKNKTI